MSTTPNYRRRSADALDLLAKPKTFKQYLAAMRRRGHGDLGEQGLTELLEGLRADGLVARLSSTDQRPGHTAGFAATIAPKYVATDAAPEALEEQTAAARNHATGYLQMMDTTALVEAVAGRLDLNRLAALQLAARGLDRAGQWVGFDRAREIHEAAVTAGRELRDRADLPYGVRFEQLSLSGPGQSGWVRDDTDAAMGFETKAEAETYAGNLRTVAGGRTNYYAMAFDELERGGSSDNPAAVRMHRRLATK